MNSVAIACVSAVVRSGLDTLANAGAGHTGEIGERRRGIGFAAVEQHECGRVLEFLGGGASRGRGGDDGARRTPFFEQRAQPRLRDGMRLDADHTTVVHGHG